MYERELIAGKREGEEEGERMEGRQRDICDGGTAKNAGHAEI